MLVREIIVSRTEVTKYFCGLVLCGYVRPMNVTKT